MWTPHDRLMTHLIHRHIKPTCKHVIDEKCTHMQGPSAIKGIHKRIRPELEKHRYFIRLDIKGFYASIDREILFKQLQAYYKDPIIDIPYDEGGNVYTPEKGIPTGSSLSPFFAAVYLKPLDAAFNNKSVFYVRYMDDILILLPNHKAYQKAKKKIFKVLRSLKLELAPKKGDRLLPVGIPFSGV